MKQTSRRLASQGYLESMEELNSGLLKTNPACGSEEDLNLRTPDYKSSTLTLRAHLFSKAKMQRTM